MLDAPSTGDGQEAESKHRILAELGEGGTATVALAVAHGPSGFNKLLVLKSLKRHLRSEPELRNMFLNEARLAARLNHPNIVQTYEITEELGIPTIVMEYLEGQPLANVITRSGRSGPFTLAMHLRVLAEALSGLHYAHELQDFDGRPLGVVHRDMSPQNVFVTFAGQVKVLDFGIAKLSASAVETHTESVKGKLRYMSPEQLTAEGVDRRSDIFSVGVMLWEAAVGQRFYQGLSDAQIMHRILNGDILSPRSVLPSVSPLLDGVIMKALAPNREDRYATAAELEAALEQVISELGSVTPRDVGKIAAEMFERERTQTRGLIESQLSKVASLSWAEYAAIEPPTLTGVGRLSGNLSRTLATQVAKVEKSRRGLWLAVLGICILFASTWALTERSSKPANSERAVSAARKPVLTRITVRFSALPKQAKLYFDDQLLPSNPHIKDMLPDGSRHLVRAEAEGYQTSTAAVILDNNEDVVLILEPKKNEPKATESEAKPLRAKRTPGRASAPVPGASAPNSAESTKTPAKAQPNCDPPYFFDSQRIKQFKPECM